MTEQLAIGATWLPMETGAHLWSDLRPVRAAAELTAMRAAGITTARIHLAWDAFVPGYREVSRHRLRDLEAVLEAARPLGMGCVLVLFAQSFGGGLLLPRYAIDRRRPRQGVQVVSDGVVEPGGPRDQWADPLMLEVQAMWLETMLGAFANHPAVAAWDLGHDPASTIRPRRTAHTVEWARLLGGLVRRAGDPVRLTAGAGDVLTARAMRLGELVPHLDELGLLVEPQRLRVAPEEWTGRPDLASTSFTVQLAMRLAAPDSGAAPPLHVVTGLACGDPADLDRQGAAAAAAAAASRAAVRVSLGLERAPGSGGGAPAAPPPPAWDIPLLDGPSALRAGGELLARLHDSGVAGITATAWSTLSDLVARSGPLDATPSLARHGLAHPDGRLRPAGVPWSALARAEEATQTPAPWPGVLDVEQYYAALPDSARDLLSGWRAERGGPVMDGQI